MRQLDIDAETAMEEMVSSNNAVMMRAPLYRRLIGSDYLRNNILLLIGSFVSGTCNLLLHPVLSRQLGPDGYGTVSSLLALLGILLLPIQFISTTVVKYASSLSAVGQTAQLNDLVRRLTALLLPVGVLITLGLVALSGLLSASLHLPTQGIIIMAGAFVVALGAQVNGGAVQGLERFGWVSSLGVLSTVLRFILAGALVFLGFGVSGAMLGVILSVVLSYLISFWPLRGLLRGGRLPSGSLRSLGSYSLTAVIAGGSTTLLMSVDTIMAKAYLSSENAGLYAALATIGKLVLFVSSSIVVVMLPRVAALHHREESATHVVTQSLVGMLALSAVAEVVFFAVPALIIRVMFGAQYVGVSGQLAWYGLAMLMFALAQPLGTYFLAIGNRLYALVILACCAVQAILVVLRHDTINQIVQAVIVSHTLLFVALFVMYAIYAMPRNWRVRAAAS